MQKPSDSAKKLKELINHAMHDMEITTSEYNSILELAHDDGHLDSEEKALLAQFHEMISNGTITRVAG